MTFASKNPNPLIARGFLLTDWRRGRDSNPRYAINVYTLSRRATSTTHPPLRFDMRCTILERVKGIEPSSKAWEAFVLPLNYTRCVVYSGWHYSDFAWILFGFCLSVMRLFMVNLAHHALFFTLPFAVFFGVAFVVLGFAFGQRDFAFDFPAGVV